MNLSTRTLGLALGLLVVFLGITVALEWWVKQETRKLQNSTLEEAQGRFQRAVRLSPRFFNQWDDAYCRELGGLVGGTVELVDLDTTKPQSPTGLVFTQPIPNEARHVARVTLNGSALVRVQVLHQRALAVIVVMALLVALVPFFIALIGGRRSLPGENGTRTPWAESRAQATGFEQLARITHERTTALAQEHGARMRAEQDLNTNRTLLGHSVAERVRLGRELHDNISQTLYAVCLTLESVHKKNTLAPELGQRVEQCMKELRRLNLEVRNYLQELEPARVMHHSFAGALDEMLQTFASTENLTIERKIDESAVARLSPGNIAEIMNILREAVSNSLRHGRARQISLQTACSDDTIILAVQDDGSGFDAGPGDRTGHGLKNMRARAEAIGGQVRIESAPGKGTRVLLTLPVASPT